jgi:uncharacterized protein
MPDAFMNDAKPFDVNPFDAKPFVAKLFIHPIKSLDRVNVGSVTVLKSGALEHDREFALFDTTGQVVNGKRHEKIHRLRSKFHLETQNLSIWLQGNERVQTFNLVTEQLELLDWLSDYFGFPVILKQNVDMGFPDDRISPGPTIISTASLEAIASWYPDLDVEEVRSRFRSNIEIGGVPAFWEDCLFGATDQTIAFQVGKVKMTGVNPCQRCIVVTRNSKTGEPDPGFQKTFTSQRQANLPAWAEADRFNHFFRLAINTRISMGESGKTINVGDTLTIL